MSFGTSPCGTCSKLFNWFNQEGEPVAYQIGNSFPYVRSRGELADAAALGCKLCQVLSELDQRSDYTRARRKSTVDGSDPVVWSETKIKFNFRLDGERGELNIERFGSRIELLAFCDAGVFL